MKRKKFYFPSCIYYGGCAIINTAKNVVRLHALTKRLTPGEIGALRGSNLAGVCLLLPVLVMSVKPLADIVGDYSCYDRH